MHILKETNIAGWIIYRVHKILNDNVLKHHQNSEISISLNAFIRSIRNDDILQGMLCEKLKKKYMFCNVCMHTPKKRWVITYLNLNFRER